GSLHARVIQYLLDHPGRRIERIGSPVVDVELAPALRQHVVGEIGDSDLDVAVPEVDAHHGAGRVLEDELNAGPPTPLAGGFAVDLEHQAGNLELRDQGGD